MTALLIFAFVSLFFSFLCSILEAVLLSVPHTYVNVAKQEGKSYAASLENLKEDVDKPLIAILTLNTVAHTVGAMGVGANAKAAFGESYWFNAISVPEVVVPSIMTILILVASEIIPKTIGATFWRQLTGFTTMTLNILVAILKYTGILFLLQLFTKLIGKGKKNIFSRADFSAMTDIAYESDAIREEETNIIKGLLKADTIKVEDVMTPSSVIISGNANESLDEFYKKFEKLRFSRIPIFEEGDRNNITRFILKDELQENIIKGNGEMKLGSIGREIILVSEEDSVPNAYKKFKDERQHLALAVDEFGAVRGIITMEDVVETILGLEIVDEYDSVDDMRTLAREKWEKRAKKMGLDLSANEEEIIEENNETKES